MSLFPAHASIRTALGALAIVAASTGAALAQAAPAAPGGAGAMDLFTSLLPILLLVVIFWFLIFRPQQKRMKQQREMLGAIRRGDTVVTTGGIVGKVTKAIDNEDLEVEIAPNTRVKVVRHMISDVRSKAEPVNDNAKSA
jgi:preprotein translocase subunit YajC